MTRRGLVCAGVCASVVAGTLARGVPTPAQEDPPALHPLVLTDDGLRVPLPRHGATVGEALRAAGVTWAPDDLLFPAPEISLTTTGQILLYRTRTVTLRVGAAAAARVTTHATSAAALLHERNILVGPLDRVEPHPRTPLAEGDTVTVTEVREDARTETEPVDPPVTVKNDPTLPLGQEVVDDPGAAGRTEVRVRVRMENGHVVSRTVLRRSVAEKPRPRIVRRGTKVTVLGAQTGRASWYRSASLTAAHQTWPPGTRVRVTRTDTGASVLVRVTGRGPFVPGRIVDVSADAFRALAPLGTGTIHVRVERLE